MPSDSTQNITAEASGAPGSGMLRMHPYALASYGAIVLIIIAAVILTRRADTPSADVAAWSGTNGSAPIDSTNYGPQLNAAYTAATSEPSTILEDLSRNDQPVAIPTVIPESKITLEPDSFDLSEFIKKLNPGTSVSTAPSTNAQSTTDLIQEAYSYIPSGLISVANSQEGRTDLQQALFNYGNEVGGNIQAFEDQYPNSVSILKDQAEDRSNPTKSAALVRYANSMTNVGQRLLSMDSVPPEAASAHKALAKSYVTIGTNLALVAQTRSDADFLYAIEVYNKSVEAYTKDFVAMATLFGAFEVRFGSADPGRVFTFTPAGL